MMEIDSVDYPKNLATTTVTNNDHHAAINDAISPPDGIHNASVTGPFIWYPVPRIGFSCDLCHKWHVSVTCFGYTSSIKKVQPPYQRHQSPHKARYHRQRKASKRLEKKYTKVVVSVPIVTSFMDVVVDKVASPPLDSVETSSLSLMMDNSSTTTTTTATSHNDTATSGSSSDLIIISDCTPPPPSAVDNTVLEFSFLEPRISTPSFLTTSGENISKQQSTTTTTTISDLKKNCNSDVASVSSSPTSKSDSTSFSTDVSTSSSLFASPLLVNVDYPTSLLLNNTIKASPPPSFIKGILANENNTTVRSPLGISPSTKVKPTPLFSIPFSLSSLEETALSKSEREVKNSSLLSSSSSFLGSSTAANTTPSPSSTSVEFKGSPLFGSSTSLGSTKQRTPLSSSFLALGNSSSSNATKKSSPLQQQQHSEVKKVSPLLSSCIGYSSSVNTPSTPPSSSSQQKPSNLKASSLFSSCIGYTSTKPTKPSSLSNEVKAKASSSDSSEFDAILEAENNLFITGGKSIYLPSSSSSEATKKKEESKPSPMPTIANPLLLLRGPKPSPIVTPPSFFAKPPKSTELPPIRDNIIADLFHNSASDDNNNSDKKKKSPSRRQKHNSSSKK